MVKKRKNKYDIPSLRIIPHDTRDINFSRRVTSRKDDACMDIKLLTISTVVATRRAVAT